MAFKAVIYKAGINACVDVPAPVTEKMKPVKGYIRVSGTINGHEFTQTLVPVKGGPFRLYVNIPMLKSGRAHVGDTAVFSLSQDFTEVKNYYPMVPALKKQLTAHRLLKQFNTLSEARQKDILKYLGSLKTEETMKKNVDKVIDQLNRAIANVRIP